MAIAKKPYEISLWEDVLTFVVNQDGGTREYENSLPSDLEGEVIAQYYKEKKLCVIGSDIMDSELRATQGKIVSNINGSITFTFNMYSHYWDEETEEFVQNPYIRYLVNERKVKVRYGAYGADSTKWYDLIIKNISENSETHTYSYTAKSLFANELSKSGFNIVLDAELENNMGNVVELTRTVLEDSDWKLKNEDFVIEQTLEEPLYKAILTSPIRGFDMRNTESKIDIEASEENPATIYLFYSDIEAENSYLQFLYVKEGYKTNDDFVITNSPNYFIENVQYESGKPTFVEVIEISDVYRGSRLVRKVETAYDSKIDKYVNVYENGIYGYTETEYASPATVQNFITNPDFFDGYTGWKIGSAEDSSAAFPEMEFVSVPDIRDVSAFDQTDFISCLRYKTTEGGQWLYNSGVVDHRHKISNFVKDEKYVLRVKYGEADQFAQSGRPSSLKQSQSILKFCVAEYSLVDGRYQIDSTRIYFSGETSDASIKDDEGYVEIIADCLKSLSYKEMITMTESLGFFISTEIGVDIYIEDVWFFPYIQKIDGSTLLPDEIYEGEIKQVYYYYDSQDEYDSLEDIEFLYKDYLPGPYTPVYIPNYEKIRSITAKESNRFNLLQEISETFECWMDFEIEHEPDGRISIDETYQQKKWVKLRDYSVINNYVGFKYGINLKSIQRIVDSDGAISKLIVKNNSNEFAEGGYCTIARAMDNPCGENFLLDFSYYIQQEMLKQSIVTNDLYLDTNGYIGYYKKLKQINKERDLYIERQANLQTDIMNYEATYETYRLSVQEAQEIQRDQILTLKQLTSYDFDTLLANQPESGADQNEMNDIEKWWTSEKVLSLMTSIAHTKSTLAKYQKLRDAARENLDAAKVEFELNNEILTSEEPAEEDGVRHLLAEKNDLNKQFYKKYSRFLQEGSWISEDYVDDNLYFLDAQSALHAASQPKLTYNIAVLEISCLDGYENYIFALGDKTTIEDTEFFGWVNKNGVRTPYKEEIVVTELTVMLDSPEQNQIKVQNYKTQFEDLFQRIAATTQSVEFSTGQYDKASSVVNNDGTIKQDTLQNSIANNALTLQNIKDQTVVWDEAGITTTSITNPSELVRIVNRGIYLSNDGGVNWTTGITGKGINANFITAGQLNTNKIEIMNGDHPSFRWDTNGISAYEFSQKDGQPSNFNYSKFIRLDQYGLYGINGKTNFLPSNEQDIWDSAHFALTWKGFMLKNDNGSVEISSSNDIQVKDGNNTRIKIGRLTSGEEPVYGIRISDISGAPVMETNNDGKLWIKNELKVGIGENSQTSIGYLEAIRDGTSYHEVIHAGYNSDQNKQFIVYEDGMMIASGGVFTGTINATGGSIGGVDIAEIPLGYEVIIESNSGVVFTEKGQEKILTAKLYFEGELVEDEDLVYQWYENSFEIAGQTSSTLHISNKDWSVKDQATYSCKISKQEV